VLPHPCPPTLHESAVRSALRYVELAERAHGPIPRPVDYNYIWGDALKVLDRVRPDLRIINLETSITTSEAFAPKGINYRMHPANVPVLAAAAVDCCVLANNHVLDWGEAGLLETLDTLARAGIRVAGAGRDDDAARAPAVLPTASGRRVLVFAFGAGDSGIPVDWAATPTRPGVNRLAELDDSAVARIARDCAAHRQPDDLVVASIHWGANWGYHVPAEQRRFARALMDRAGVHLVHGHSSHHPKATELYHDRLILYGCGDLVDDYEGISGYEEFRDDLVLMYFPTLEAGTGRLTRLAMAPMQIHRFRLRSPSPSDRAWLQSTLDHECRRFGHRIARGAHHTLSLAAA
jgi:poly-gamma-glutamate synthesis protein (capsule biosynthesis protein)